MLYKEGFEKGKEYEELEKVIDLMAKEIYYLDDMADYDYGEDNTIKKIKEHFFKLIELRKDANVRRRTVTDNIMLKEALIRKSILELYASSVKTINIEVRGSKMEVKVDLINKRICGCGFKINLSEIMDEDDKTTEERIKRTIKSLVEG